MSKLKLRNRLVIFITLCYSLLLANNSLAGKILVENDNIFLPEDIAFFDDQGSKHFLAEFDKQVLLISFWATWCASCVQEMPELDILQKDFRRLPFKVIALSQDFQGISVIKQFFQDKEIRHLNIYHDQNNKLFNELQIVGLPTSLLVDQSGKVVLRFIGAIDWHSEEIRNKILSYVEGSYPTPRNSYKSNVYQQIPKSKAPNNQEHDDQAPSEVKENKENIVNYKEGQ